MSLYKFRTTWSQCICYGFIAVVILYGLLLIPESDQPVTNAVEQPTIHQPFMWKQDTFWRVLETRFLRARKMGCDATRHNLDSLFVIAENNYALLATTVLQPGDRVFRAMEQNLFEMAPLLAACPDRLMDYCHLAARIRTAVKKQSWRWPMNEPASRVTLYRLLYGSRAAVEEVMLQASGPAAEAQMIPGFDESSQTPWASMLGVTVHSGDILLSRGGAATSALIARGNDFAGNFSHVALLYVDPKTHLIRVIEAHIERGVAVATLDEYLQDVKLRVMVLRLRADLPAMQADPQLPHRAAEYALHRAQKEHIPYDFAMNFADSTRWFCSEVASAAYRCKGINLWMGLSHISSPGLRRWLAQFGVRQFSTQEPADLEYDPQLQVVAEWRDLETLRKDHYDNAVTEVLLDAANEGAPLRYRWYMLPVARLARAYSMILNHFGRIGPIPEGMHAAAGLRNKWYTAIHEEIKTDVIQQSDRFEAEKGYVAPYWQLVAMARASYETRFNINTEQPIPKHKHP
jgi:hypothetical protein